MYKRQFKTHEQVTRELGGGDWEANVEQLKAENAKLAEAGGARITNLPSSGADDGDGGDGKEMCIRDRLKLVKSYEARRPFFGGAAILLGKEVEAAALLLARRSCAGLHVRQRGQRRRQKRRKAKCSESLSWPPMLC